jgi:uncharacterized protein
VKTFSLRDRDLAVLRRTFRRFPCVREVRLFGSRATGTARRASDIDLAISAPDATADQWLELTEALEAAPIIYEFDLVRTERAHSRRLSEKIVREGVPIYPESTTTEKREAARLNSGPG